MYIYIVAIWVVFCHGPFSLSPPAVYYGLSDSSPRLYRLEGYSALGGLLSLLALTVFGHTVCWALSLSPADRSTRHGRRLFLGSPSPRRRHPLRHPLQAGSGLFETPSLGRRWFFERPSAGRYPPATKGYKYMCMR